mgnify:CR=1 FL=1
MIVRVRVVEAKAYVSIPLRWRNCRFIFCACVYVCVYVFCVYVVCGATVTRTWLAGCADVSQTPDRGHIFTEQ